MSLLQKKALAIYAAEECGKAFLQVLLLESNFQKWYVM
jgi:hypothetical protein